MNGKEIKIIEIFFEFHIRENDCNVTHVTVTNRTSISKCLMIDHLMKLNPIECEHSRLHIIKEFINENEIII